jgi:hypothetical protein
MRRLAILAILVLTTAAAPLAALCGVDCGVHGRPTVRTPPVDPACPLHEEPAPAEHHHTCDHDHRVAPATATKADSAVAARDTAVGVISLEQPAVVIADLGDRASPACLRSIARPPLRLFPLRI